MRLVFLLFCVVLLSNLSLARNFDFELRLSPIYFELPYFSYRVENSNKNYFKFQPKYLLSAGYYSVNFRAYRPKGNSWGAGLYYLNTRKAYSVSFDDARFLVVDKSQDPAYGWLGRGTDFSYNTNNLGIRMFYSIPIRKVRINIAGIIGAEIKNNSTVYYRHSLNGDPTYNIIKTQNSYVQYDYIQQSYIQFRPDGSLVTPRGYSDSKFEFSPNEKKWDIEQLALEISLDYPVYRNKAFLQIGILGQRSYDYLSYEVVAGLKDGYDLEPLETFNLNSGYSFVSVFLGLSYKFK